MNSAAAPEPAPPDVSAMLDAWREQGADRISPVRFHFIEALARRASARTGPARRELDRKLARLVEAYQRDVGAAGSRAGPPTGETTGSEPGRQAGAAMAGPLARMLDDFQAGRAPAVDGTEAATRPSAPAYPDLALLDYFRDTWSRYSARRQLKQSRERVPENAGPLNSSLLVHRTLSLMGEVSPDYLQYFLSYLDALSWMEQASGADILSQKEGSRAAGARKSPRAGGSR
ncbi:DUF2894 domain-containing protein [Bordetella bronchialis]|nr:DUF2894 domain-containing protein [Bordetella bronchialis]